MLETTITASLIAALAGVGTYYSWERNRLLSALLAVVTAGAAVVAALFAFIGALALIFQILAILLLLLGIWLIWKVATRGSKQRKPETGSELGSQSRR